MAEPNAAQSTFIHYIELNILSHYQATNAHAEVDSQAQLARDALRELSAHVRELSTQRGAVGPLLDSVARAVARLTEHRCVWYQDSSEREELAELATNYPVPCY